MDQSSLSNILLQLGISNSLASSRYFEKLLFPPIYIYITNMKQVKQPRDKVVNKQ